MPNRTVISVLALGGFLFCGLIPTSGSAPVPPGKIEVQGTVRNVGADGFTLSVETVISADGGTARLSTPRPKQIDISSYTQIHGVSGEKASRSEIKAGMTVRALGVDLGVGSELPASQIWIVSTKISPQQGNLHRERSHDDLSMEDTGLETGGDSDLEEAAEIVAEVNRQIREPNHLSDLRLSRQLCQAARTRAYYTASITPQEGWGPWLHLNSSSPWEITHVLARLHFRCSPYAEEMEFMGFGASPADIVSNLHWVTDSANNAVLDRHGNPVEDEHWRSLKNPRLTLLGVAVAPISIPIGDRVQDSSLIMMEAGGSHFLSRR